MILFLYGEDTYRMKEKMREIIEKYKKSNKSCLSLEFFDGSKKAENVFKAFDDGLRQTSIFKEKKLIVLNNVLENSDFKEKFLENQRKFLASENIIVFFQESGFNKNNALFNFLKKNSKTQEFSLLTGQRLRNWILKKLGKGKISNRALDLLLNYTGSDLWRLSNEISKLASYKKGGIIEEKDVRLQVRPNIETDIFKTIDAIAERKKGKALDFLQKHLEKGDSPIYLISMISYQFRNLLAIKDLAEKQTPYNLIIKKSGIHPFVVKKTYSLCRRFSFEELKGIYQKIFKADFKIKTGLISPEVALDLLIAES